MGQLTSAAGTLLYDPLWVLWHCLRGRPTGCVRHLWLQIFSAGWGDLSAVSFEHCWITLGDGLGLRYDPHMYVSGSDSIARSLNSISLKKRTGVFLGLSLGLLLAPLGAQEKKQEPDAGELLKQGLVNISDFNTERIVYAKKQEFAKFIPAGQEVKVQLFYRVYKPVPAEDLEIKVLDDIHPFPVKYLAEKGVEYREEETTIKGTGAYVK